MEKKKNFLFSGALIAGALTATSGLNANANLLEFEDLGTGGELRSSLLNHDRPMPASLELNCGEKKSKEGKCGEGKCGESKKGEKAKKKESKSSEHKCGEGKCGEGKCGEKKKEEGKKSKKTEQKPEL